MNERDYEILYDLPAGEYDGRLVEGIRTVTIRAGKSLKSVSGRRKSIQQNVTKPFFWAIPGV